MSYDLEEYLKAKEQLNSMLYKLKKASSTLQNKENSERYKSQITLIKRRMMAISLSIELIEEKIK